MSCFCFMEELLFKLHSIQRFSKFFLFMQFRSLRNFGLRQVGIISNTPPPHSLVGVSLSAQIVLKFFGLFSHSFRSSVSFSHVSEIPYIVFVPKSFVISSGVNLFSTRLCAFTWKILNYCYYYGINLLRP